MKATRLFLAAIAISLFTACSATDITAPQSTEPPTEIQRGALGSGMG